MALNSSASKLLKIRHTVNSGAALIEAKNAINLITLQIEGTRQVYEKMLSLDVTKASLESFFREVTGIKDEAEKITENKTLKTMFELYEGGLGQSQVKPSLFKAYQAVTEFDTHHRILRGEAKLENRLLNTFNVKSLSNIAYDVARSMVA
jgi:hypothetical protein